MLRNGFSLHIWRYQGFVFIHFFHLFGGLAEGLFHHVALHVGHAEYAHAE